MVEGLHVSWGELPALTWSASYRQNREAAQVNTLLVPKSSLFLLVMDDNFCCIYLVDGPFPIDYIHLVGDV